MRKEVVKLHSGGDGGHQRAIEYAKENQKVAIREIEAFEKAGKPLAFYTTAEIDAESGRIYSEICNKINSDNYDKITSLKEMAADVEGQLREFEMRIREEEMNLQGLASQEKEAQLCKDIDEHNQWLSQEKERLTKLNTEWEALSK